MTNASGGTDCRPVLVVVSDEGKCEHCHGQGWISGITGGKVPCPVCNATERRTGR